MVLIVEEEKKTPSNAGDAGWVPGLGRCPIGGHSNPFQYSCLENPMDRRDRWAMAHKVAVGHC